MSAGFDAHRRDPLASCMLETSSFAQLALHVRRLAEDLDVPVGVVLEGGYDLEGAVVVGGGHARGVSSDNGEAPRSVERGPLVEAAAETVGLYWKL